MIDTFSRITLGLRDMLGSWSEVNEYWDRARNEGRIIEHRIGPESAAYEFADDESMAVFVETVRAQQFADVMHQLRR